MYLTTSQCSWSLLKSQTHSIFLLLFKTDHPEALLFKDRRSLKRVQCGEITLLTAASKACVCVCTAFMAEVIRHDSWDFRRYEYKRYLFLMLTSNLGFESGPAMVPELAWLLPCGVFFGHRPSCHPPSCSRQI